jgi:N-acetylneuraminate synthase
MSAFVIAEAGVNHNGSLEMAKELIEAGAKAGADAVKFQTFRAAEIVSRFAPKAAYQQRNTDDAESQLDMIKKLELSIEDHRILIEHARQNGIEFLSTPFDLSSLRLLVDDLGLRTIKIPSGEITNAPFLVKIAATGCRIILSTGMSTLGEVESALSMIAFGALAPVGQPPGRAAFEAAYMSPLGQELLRERVVLLHCSTEYPAPIADVNLKAMDAMAQAFGLPVGYSDHTEGIHISVAAAARGACLIEKHFTLDKTLPGPDHKASLEPDELSAMIRAIKDIGLALGDGVKRPSMTELKNRDVVRKSLVAARPIAVGELFSEDNLICKRPGTGISPIAYWNRLGTTASRDYGADELVEE